MRKFYVRAYVRPPEFEKLSTTDIDDAEVSTELKYDDVEFDESNDVIDVALPTDNPEDNWPPISWDVFSGWQPFFDLGLPGALSLFFEW